MKCPKCGSTNVTEEERKNGFYFCLNCYFKWKDNYKQPKPTTAEMLLWLVKNDWFYSYNSPKYNQDESHWISIINQKCDLITADDEDFINCRANTFDEAIRAAYKAAKEKV